MNSHTSNSSIVKIQGLNVLVTGAAGFSSLLRLLYRHHLELLVCDQHRHGRFFSSILDRLPLSIPDYVDGEVIWKN